MASRPITASSYRVPLATLLAALIGTLPIAAFLIANAAGVGGAL